MSRPEINDLTMVRRANLLKLMADGNWDRREFSKRTKVKYATLSAYLGPSPKSNIGEKTANLIETNLGKKIGWLDKDRRQATTTDGTDAPVLSGDAKSSRPSNCHATITMDANTLKLVNHPITNYERDAIIALLFSDN